MEKIKLDAATKKWFESKPIIERFSTETTLAKCEKCGLFYKASLGHKCKAKEMEGMREILFKGKRKDNGEYCWLLYGEDCPYLKEYKPAEDDCK